MIESAFRPTFLIRSVLQAAGQPRTETSMVPIETGPLAMSGDSVENLWTAFEPLILTLTLAGYDCPEVVVANPSWGDPQRDAGYLRLFPHKPVVTYEAGDWRERTGVSVGSDVWTVYLVRVTVRRTLGAPSLHPPIPLTGGMGYTRQLDGDDRFANPADGWIALVGLKPLESSADTVATRVAEPIRQLVAGALADAWTREGANKAVGLMRSLNPLFWETANDRELPVRDFVSLAGEVWAFLASPGQVRAFLQADSADAAVSLTGLRQSAGAATSRSKALRDMKARMGYFHPRHTRLDTGPGDWRHRHWALTLFELHEFGLIRILPFPLDYQVRIPSIDLTGWYETDPYYPTVGPVPVIATMHLSQAGDVISGWWHSAQFVRWDIEAQWPLAPTPQPVSFTAFLTRPGLDADATISGIPTSDGSDEDVDFAVTVTFAAEFNGQRTYRMIRRTRLAQVAPSVRLVALPTDSPPVSEGFLASPHYLSEKGLGLAMDVLVAGVVDVSTHNRLRWAERTRILEASLGAALADNNVLTYTGTNVPPSPMLDRFQVEAKGALSRTAVPAADGRDAWTHLQTMLTWVAISDVDTANTLRKLLGIGSSPPHEYTLQFGGVGVLGEIDEVLGIGGGGMYILGRMHHETARCSGNPAGWPGWFWGVVLEGGGSIGAESGAGVDFVKLSDPDTIWAETEWFPDDFATRGLTIPFRCAFATLGGGGEGQWRTTGGVAGGWDLIDGVVFVSRTAAGIAAGWNDGWYVSAGIGVSVGFGVAGGFSLGVLTGRTTAIGNPGPQQPAPEVTPVDVFVGGAEQLSFATGVSSLTTWGRARLARYVAKYRALFESPQSTIVIEGDASPAGSEADNETLSWRRALAVYAEIKGLLSAPATGDFDELNALNIGEARVELRAFGEVEARLRGVPDGLNPEEWRRAKVVINGSAVGFI